MSWAALFERAAGFAVTETAVRDALARRREATEHASESADREGPDQ